MVLIRSIAACCLRLPAHASGNKFAMAGEAISQSRGGETYGFGQSDARAAGERSFDSDRSRLLGASRSARRDGSLGRDLARSRLEHRSRRLRHVIAVLRERAGGTAGQSTGTLAPRLERAIAEFSAELSQVDRWLADDGAERRAGGLARRRVGPFSKAAPEALSPREVPMPPAGAAGGTLAA